MDNTVFSCLNIFSGTYSLRNKITIKQMLLISDLVHRNYNKMNPIHRVRITLASNGHRNLYSFVNTGGISTSCG